jgi:hypothetical protein
VGWYPVGRSAIGDVGHLGAQEAEEAVVERGAQGRDAGGGGGEEGRQPGWWHGREGERAAEEGPRHVVEVSASAAAGEDPVGDYRRRAAAAVLGLSV